MGAVRGVPAKNPGRLVKPENRS